MPEGPSIVILRETTAHLAGRTVDRVTGNSRIGIERLAGRRLRAVCSWGKHYLLAFDPDLTLRVHFLLYGSWRLNERREAAPRLQLGFGDEELNLYACSLRYIEVPLDEVYDWRGDIMADAWDPALARRRLRARPGMAAGDALLDQDIFAGVGNIIRNEVLFRIRVDPRSPLGALRPWKLRQLVEEARRYSFQFLEWKKAFVLRKHYRIYNQARCPRDGHPVQRAKLGRWQRRTFWCGHCQILYGSG